MPLSTFQVSTPAILIRRTAYGDFDLILTFFSLSAGKISLIAKSARKSARRFVGVLELFSELDIVGSVGRKPGMPVLHEASLRQPFEHIRAVPARMAFASYWVELVNDWMEERVEQAELYHLLRYALSALDQGQVPEDTLSIVFQMRLLRLSGHSPNLQRCAICLRQVEAIGAEVVGVDIAKGGIACPGCAPGIVDSHRLAKGTVKQLLWVASGDLLRAARIRFSPAAARESLDFLERFVPYHLGRQPRSLRVLRQLRGDR
jgi:DNA repair protein RecO (recombination protein O)